MLDVVGRPEQAQLLSAEGDEDDGAGRGLLRQPRRDVNQRRGSRCIIVRAIMDLAPDIGSRAPLPGPPIPR